MKLIFIIFFLLLLVSNISAFEESEFDFDYPAPTFNNNTAMVNTSTTADFWDLLDTPADLLLSMFSATWIDTTLDMNGKNINGSGNISLKFGDLISEQNPDGADAIRIKGTDYIDVVIGGMTGLFAVWNVADTIPIFYVNERGDTNIAGDVDIGGDILLNDGDLTTTGDGIFDELTLTGPTSTDYKWTHGSSQELQMILQSQTDDTQSWLSLMTKKGDGGDNLQFRIWAKGIPAFVEDREYFRIIYNAASRYFEIATTADGTGTQMPLRLSGSGLGVAQLVLNIDGSIDFGGDVNVNGNSIIGVTKIQSQASANIEYDAQGFIHEFMDDISVNGNITSQNVFIPQYMFAHTNATIPVLGVGTWTNISFAQEDSDIKFGIAHTYNDNTNHTFMIMEDGIYEVDYDLDIEDNSGTASDIDIAARLAYTNGTEIKGSVFETDVQKQGISAELSHDFLMRVYAGESFMVQFTASDADVQISTHGTFGDHPESATITIKKIANL